MSSLSQLVNGWELQASIGRAAAVDGLVSSTIQVPDEATTRLGHSSRDMISVIFNLAAHNAQNGVCTIVCWFHYGRAQCSVDLRWMARICWAPSFIMWPTKDRHSTESTPLMPSFSVAAPRGHEPPPILPLSSHSRPLSLLLNTSLSPLAIVCSLKLPVNSIQCQLWRRTIGPTAPDNAINGIAEVCYNTAQLAYIIVSSIQPQKVLW